MASFLIAFKALLLLSAARWSSVLGAPVSSENDQPETDREQYTTGPSDDGLDIDKDLLDRDAKGGFGDRWKQTRSFLEDHKLRHGTCKNENQCPGRQCCTRNITPNEDGGVTFDAVGSCMKVSDIENLQVTRIEDDLVGDDVANTLSTVAFGQDILGICRPGLLSAPERKRRQAQAQVTADSLVQLVTGPDVFVATEVEITEPPTTEEPITTTSEAITTTVEVVTTTPEPVTTTVAEVTTTTGPVTTTDEVVTTTPEPVTTTVAEVTTTTGPVTTTDEVVTTTPEPITTTVAEVTTTTGPVTTTDEVVTTTPEPITTTAVEPATTTGPVLERRGPELIHFEHQARAAEGLLKDLITELEILDG